MTNVVRRPEAGQAVYIGLDVSRTKWVFHVRWSGQEQRRVSTPAGLAHLHAVLAAYADASIHLVYEACGFGYAIAWDLTARGIAVTVVPPSTVARVPGANVKTDRLDARTLAIELEQGRLKRVRVPTRADHERRQLSRTYEQALKDKKRAQARVRSLMQDHGYLGPRPTAGWATYARWVVDQTVPPLVRVCLDELLAARMAAAASARRLKRAVLTVAREPAYQPVVMALSAQGGVGPFTAIRLRLELGDITQFRTADSFPNFLGLTPNEHSSGDRIQRGHIAKRGPGHVRGWLVQSAWASLRTTGDPALRACFDRLVPRTGKKRAIIAVARRLALRVRARWLAHLNEQEAV
jgi:transposase